LGKLSCAGAFEYSVQRTSKNDTCVVFRSRLHWHSRKYGGCAAGFEHPPVRTRPGLRRRTTLTGAVAGRGFDPGLVLAPRVDRSSLITVRSTKYSVPVRFINRKVRVSLQATQVRIFDGRTRSPPTVSGVSAPRIAHMSKMPRRC
jgi:hypothetical protein